MAEVIVALDTATADEALRLTETLGDRADFYKVGLELYTSAGPSIVMALLERGKRVFLDLKLHDIPNTVGGAVAAASHLGVHLLTVHASGGAAMLEAAREAAAGALRLVGVTVLTSLAAADLTPVWGREVRSVPDESTRLAALARRAGLDGVVASASDVERIRREVGRDLLVVVPGIRPAGSAADDQRRVATPAEAVRAGADYLVLGRAVTRAPDPASALAAILEEVTRATAQTS